MKKILLLSIIFLVTCQACKKGSSGSGGNSGYWQVKYEITCTNINTKVAIVFRDEAATVQQVGVPSGVAVPWSYGANFSKDPGLALARTLEITVADAFNFNSGDVLTLKIYVDGIVVNQTTNPAAILTYLLH